MLYGEQLQHLKDQATYLDEQAQFLKVQKLFIQQQAAYMDEQGVLTAKHKSHVIGQYLYLEQQTAYTKKEADNTNEMIKFIEEQVRSNKRLLTRMGMYRAGELKAEAYRKHRGKKTVEMKKEHEKHIMLMNRFLETVKNAVNENYDFPQEVSKLLINYIISRKNGDDEWPIISELTKFKIDETVEHKKSNYLPIIFWIIHSHHDALEEKKDKPNHAFRAQNRLYDNASSDIFERASTYGYRLGINNNKIKQQDFFSFFETETGISSDTVKNHLIKYDLLCHITEYINEIS